ncbi:hypothetical protein [Duganella fentianensis]|uniref:hypothetical protein n=1 Tax=Duganella fentianensis TaxID=2692177 RepID=UPI0032B1CC5C
MIASLSGFDNLTAAGILARMALALDDDGNPAALDRLPDEIDIRQRVRAELYEHLGLRIDDNSEEAVERFTDALDVASDSLLGPLALEDALIGMSRKGQLPSDLYHIRVLEPVEEIYGEKWPAEYDRLEATIRLPDQEQHYGEPEPGTDGHLVSIFAKHFPDPFSFRSFTLLVLGQRQGTKLTVVHVWRLYADKVDVSGVTDLLDVVRRFTNVYGEEIIINGKKGRFFETAQLSSSIATTTEIEIVPRTVIDRRGRKRDASISTIDIVCFQQSHPKGGKIASLIVAIDRDKYRASLEAHGW